MAQLSFLSLTAPIKTSQIAFLPLTAPAGIPFLPTVAGDLKDLRKELKGNALVEEVVEDIIGDALLSDKISRHGRITVLPLTATAEDEEIVPFAIHARADSSASIAA